MDGVLEGAALLCVCKLACSLLCLPAVSACRSPMTFCCCCLLIFTDIAVTIFLFVLWVSKPWLPPLVVSADVIALRFLLFLGHTYGAVLGFTMVWVAVETVMKLCCPKLVSGLGPEVEGKKDKEVEITVEQEDPTCLGCVTVEVGKEGDQDRCLSHLPDFLCCLLVWAFSGLHGALWSRASEELWAKVCIQTTGSLPLCLPNLFTSLPELWEPCWGLVVVGFLIILVVIQGLILRIKQTTLADEPTVLPQKTSSADEETFVQPPSSKAAAPRLLTLAPAAGFFVDSGKTRSRCCAPSVNARNPTQLSQCHHGNAAISLRLECLPSDGEQEAGNAGMPSPAVVEERSHLEGDSFRAAPSQHGWQSWFFPSPGARLMTGLVCLFSLCVLPLSLSVNILLVYSLDAVLEWSTRPAPIVPHGGDTPLTEVAHPTEARARSVGPSPVRAVLGARTLRTL